MSDPQNLELIALNAGWEGTGGEGFADERPDEEGVAVIDGPFSLRAAINAIRPLIAAEERAAERERLAHRLAYDEALLLFPPMNQGDSTHKTGAADWIRSQGTNILAPWQEAVQSMTMNQVQAMLVFARASDFSLTYGECAGCAIEAAILGKDEKKRADHIKALLEEGLNATRAVGLIEGEG